MRAVRTSIGCATARTGKWRQAVVGLGVAIALAGGSGAVAATPSPQSRVATAFKTLTSDIARLGPKQASKRTRRALLNTAGQARRRSRRKPCQAVTVLLLLRSELTGIRVPKAKGRAPAAGSARGRIAADVLQAQVSLLQLPGAKRCGGGVTSKVSEASPTTLSDDATQIQLRVDLPPPTFVAQHVGGTDWLQMFMPGMDTTGGSPGNPGLPAITQFFGIPSGANVSVTVDKTQGYDVRGVRLYPEQPQAVDIAPPPSPSRFANPPFKINKAAYTTAQPTPAQVADARSLGAMRDLPIGGVDATGGQYFAKTGRLHVFTSITYTVHFGGGNERTFGDGRVDNPWNGPFVRNYAALMNSSAIFSNVRRLRFPFCGEDMLIVTSPALQPAAATFASAKTAAGYNPRVVVVGSGPGQIGTTPAQIQAYIRGELSSLCELRPVYVVLVGDTANVPTFEVPCTSHQAPGDTCTIASDLPYSLADNSDLFADVELGRLPAPDLGTANTVVNKIVGYETSMPAPAGDDFYHHATITSYFQPAADPTNHTDTRGFTKTSETVRNGMRFNGYAVDRVYTTDSASVDPQFYYDGTPIPSYLRRPNFGWDGTGADLLADYNAGRFLIFHRDHGWQDGWANPQLTSSDVPSMSNGTKLPVVFGVNCASGMFDTPGHPSFAELQVERSGGGAVAAFGDSRNSPSFANNHMALGFFDALFPNILPTFGASSPTRRLGDVLLSGKRYMASQNNLDGQGDDETYQEHYLYHLFGDPSGQMWADPPHQFQVPKLNPVYEAVSPVNPGDPGYIVHVPIPEPVPEGTIVTLYNSGQAIGRALVHDGVADITPEMNTDRSNLTVSIDAQGFLPVSKAVENTATTLVLSCPGNQSFGASAPVSGHLNPAVGGAAITVTYTRPDGTTDAHQVSTDANGDWSDKESVSMSGNWSVTASYAGDSTHAGSTSNSCAFAVAQRNT